MTEKAKIDSAGGFDPFNDRPSRTVRNTLSEMLGRCLARGEAFPDAPQDLLERFPGKPYREYILDRTFRYRAATCAAMAVEASPVARAAVLWRQGLYFEAHEILEPGWLAASGEVREGLKGLIQAMGVFVHQEAGHDATAMRLARKAVARLRRYGSAVGGGQAGEIDMLVARLEGLTAEALR
jgi:hypothetical protein